MIEARGLTRRFGRILAVDGIDLSIGPRGLVGFLGPNGAGKTTTMRMLTGFLPMHEGTAIVAGFDVFEQPLEVKARVGYLPEQPPLYPELTVGEYLRFVADLRGVPSGSRLSRVGQVMERVGLRGFERRLVSGLSKGYRQRVGLAGAILHEPPVLVLDEPTSGLDPAQLVPIRALVRELAEDRLVLLSTHVLAEVELLCDRVLIMNRGRLAGDGTVEALAEQVGAGAWIEFACDGAGDAALSELAALDAVSEAAPLPEAVPGRARFRLRGGDELVPAVAALAARRGWIVRALAPRRARLEDVFLALVGGDA